MQKGIVVMIAIAALFCAGCQKDTGDSFKSYITFKLDNVPVACNANIKATFVPPTIGPDKIITISGNWDGGSIAIELNEPQVLTTGTYSFNNNTLRTADILTAGPTGRPYSATWGGVYNPLVKGSGQVTFTEINAEYVKGTFDFVTHIDAATNTFKSVTSGVFHIRRG